MMEFSSRNWFVKWVYLTKLLAGDPLPHSTSACAMFWRAFVYTPIAAAAILALSPVIALVFGLYVGVRALALGMCKIWTALDRNVPESAIDKVAAPFMAVGSALGVVGAFIGALYNKACPIVRIRQ